MHTSGRVNELLVGLTVALLQGYGARAQIQSNATCVSNFSWAANSLNQPPCLVAAYLQGACSAGVWTTPALPRPANGTKLAYNPPDPSSRNVCTCSWAVYNLLSACAACQDSVWRLWPAWAVYCETATDNLISTQAFPPQVPVPPGTVIPEYAAKDPSTWTGGLFNLTEARAIGSHNIRTTTPGSSSSFTATNPNASNTSSASNGRGPPVGPIIGGVVGGLLGILLIAVLAVFLLCPSRFKRGQKGGEGYHSTTREKHAVRSSPPVPLGSGAMPYDASTAPATSHQGLLAPTIVRPPAMPRFTSSVYSFGTSIGHSVTSSMGPQQIATNQVPYHQPTQGATMGSTPSPPNLSMPSLVPETPTVDLRTTPSVRSFFTRATPRHGHVHTPSDTSITSASSLLPRIQQNLWMQQPGNGNNVIVPYVTPNAASMPSLQHQYQVDRKIGPVDLQYNPPPESQTVTHSGESGPSEGSTIGIEHALLQSGLFSPTTTESIYSGIPSSIITDGESDADRRTNMSPANASSILEAAPPYASDEHRDLGGRGMPLRRTPRLPDVDEWPEEKARFANAAVDRPV